MTGPAAGAPAVAAAAVRAPFTGRARRDIAFCVLTLPLILPGPVVGFAVGIFWVAGLVDLPYPFWWLSFRNHSPGVRLNPVPVITPFDWSGTGGHFRVATFPGTFAAFGAGVGMLLAAPWVTRAVVAADRWLIRGLRSEEHTSELQSP